MGKVALSIYNMYKVGIVGIKNYKLNGKRLKIKSSCNIWVFVVSFFIQTTANLIHY